MLQEKTMADNNDRLRYLEIEVSKLAQKQESHEELQTQRYEALLASQTASNATLKVVRDTMTAGVGAAKIFRWIVVLAGSTIGLWLAVKAAVN